MKNILYLIAFIFCFSSPVCYGEAKWKEDADSGALIHIASEFSFPNTVGEFQRGALIEGKNSYHGKSSGISYEVPGENFKLIFILIPKSIKPTPNATELFYLSLTTQANVGEGSSIQEISPPEYGNPSERLAAWVLMDKSKRTGMFSFVLADRDHLISIKAFHTLDLDPEWMTSQINTFLMSLNWSE